MFFAVFTALLWGVLPFALVPLFRSVDVLTVISFRFLFSMSCVFVFLFFQYQGNLRKVFQLSFPVFAAGILLSLNYFGFSYGLSLTTASTAQVLIQSGPLIFTLLGLLVLKERLSRIQILGFLFASIGFVIFYRDKLESFIGSISGYQEGVFWVFMGGVSWGVYALFHKFACRRHDPQQINLMIYFVGSVLYAPFLNLQELSVLSNTAWILLIIASLNTVLAYGSLSEALKRISATKVSIILCLNPILTMLISALGSFLKLSWIYHEVLREFAWLGAGLVILGAICVVSGKDKGPMMIKKIPAS